MLLITHKWKKNHFGGRQQYSRCLIESLKMNNYINFEIYNINPYIKQNFSDKFFNLKTDYLSNIDISNIIKIIKKNKTKIIIIDCSTMGLLCKKIKSFDKDIKIIIIHQHIEFSFFVKLFYNSKNIKNLFIAFKMYINEYLSTKYSDKQIFFTKRDLNSAIALYKSKNPKVLPVAQPVINNPEKKNNLTRIEKPYILFVGGGRLLPNSIGILWFIKKVLSKIDLSLVVIGTGYEELAKKKFKKVIFLGKVNDLSNLYKNSEFVVAPIFSGSGMKTKVAESAGYGKTVFATGEAIIGYEKFEGKIFIKCQNEAEFIDNIKNYKKLIFKKEKILEIFKKNYSIEAMSLNFNKLIKSV